MRRKLVKDDRNYDVAVQTGEGTVLESCPFGDECTNEGTRTYRPAATRSIAFRVGCAAAAPLCPNSPASLAVTEATATIDDPEPPVVDRSLAGWQRTAEVLAEDASGIRSVAGRDQAVQLHAAPAVPGPRRAPRSIARMASTRSRSRRPTPQASRGRPR